MIGIGVEAHVNIGGLCTSGSRGMEGEMCLERLYRLRKGRKGDSRKYERGKEGASPAFIYCR